MDEVFNVLRQAGRAPHIPVPAQRGRRQPAAGRSQAGLKQICGEWFGVSEAVAALLGLPVWQFLINIQMRGSAHQAAGLPFVSI